MRVSPRTVLMLASFALLVLARAEEPATPPPPPERSHITYQDVTLDADRLVIDMDQQDIYAEGRVELTSPDGVLQADSARFNQQTGAGYLEGVQGMAAPFRFTAESMSIDPQALKHIQHAALTTCVEERPHYRLLARDFIVFPDKRFEARRISVEYAGHRLFTIPRFRGKLSGEDTEVPPPLITAGRTSIDGIYLGANYLFPVGENTELRANVRYGTQQVFRGGMYLTQSFPVGHAGAQGEAKLTYSHREDVQNRLLVSDTGITTDAVLRELTVSRQPALDVKVDNLALPRPLNKFTLQVGAGIGRFREEPTEVSASRSQLWGLVSTPAYNVGPTQVHAEYGARAAFYPDSHYTTHLAALVVESPPTPKYYYNASYLLRRTSGTTPFLFDRVLIPDELYTEVEFPISKSGRWRLDLWNRQDLRAGRSRDYNIMVIYRQDCLSYALSYNRATESLGVGIVLNAFGSFRKGAGKIGFTQ